MPIIPEKSTEFRDPSFWKEFYRDSKNSFEWYGNFDNFGQILAKYLKTSDKILQIGCGNSELASQLYDNGYRTIDSIDIDQGVIDKQIARNSLTRPELQFSCCSALEINSPSETYNVVLDKGTLDALLPFEKETMTEEVRKMFAEVCRVLALGGRYIVVSLAQKQVLDSFLLYFLERRNFMVRVERNNDANWKFPVPVFFLIATKLRVPLPSPFFRKLKEEASMILYGKDGIPRYRIAVVDNKEISRLNSFAVFIIPVGRDHDWIFATDKGRALLRKQCGKSRLAVVTLYRDQNYENMEQIKDELRPYVLKLAPANLTKSRGPSIEYLSLGEVDVKKTCASGHSNISGPWTVEDVRIQNSLYRRLIFLSSQNLVQSEAKLIKNKKGREVVDLNTLTSEYHEAMLAALPFTLPSGGTLNQTTKARLLVLGLGGGVLPSFLHRKFPSASVVAVELDDQVSQIAKDWFSLDCGLGLNVIIKDALAYVQEVVERKDESILFDSIFIDVAGCSQENGLSCPLPSFVTENALKTMHSALRDRGVLVLNLVTRNEEVAEQVKNRILAIFQYFFVHCGEEDINQVLICPKTRISLTDARKACEHFKKEKGSLGKMFAFVSSLKICEKRKK